MRKFIDLKTVSLVTIILMITSCETAEKRNGELLEKVRVSIEKLDISLADNDVLMIINMSGCSACYSRALKYAKETYTHTNRLHFVITGYNSKKSLRLRLGQDVFNKGQIYLDEKGYIYQSGIKQDYPLITYKENGEFQSLDIADLKNSLAYSRLSEYLSIK